MPFFTPCNCNGIFSTNSGNISGIITPANAGSGQFASAFRASNNKVYTATTIAGQSGSIIDTASNTAAIGFASSFTVRPFFIDQTLDRAFSIVSLGTQVIQRFNFVTGAEQSVSASATSSPCPHPSLDICYIMAGTSSANIRIESRKKTDLTIILNTLNLAGRPIASYSSPICVYVPEIDRIIAWNYAGIGEVIVLDSNFNLLGAVNVPTSGIISCLYSPLTNSIFVLADFSTNISLELDINGKLINSFVSSFDASSGAVYNPVNGYIYIPSKLSPTKIALLNPSTKQTILTSILSASVPPKAVCYAPNKHSIYTILSDGSTAFELI